MHISTWRCYRRWTALSHAIDVNSLFSSKLQEINHVRTIYVSKLCPNHYQTLGVSKSATAEEIRTAYVEKSKILHPDHDPSDSSLHGKFVNLQEAYDTLRLSTNRRDYDANLDYGTDQSQKSNETYAAGNTVYSSRDQRFTSQTKKRSNTAFLIFSLSWIFAMSLVVLLYIQIIWKATGNLAEEQEEMHNVHFIPSSAKHTIYKRLQKEVDQKAADQKSRSEEILKTETR